MGLPFFNPGYDPSVKVDYYSPVAAMESVLHGQMTSPYFPVHMESIASKSKFHTLDGPLKLLGASISYRKMNHPGDSYSYKLEYGNHKLIYATDSELSANDFIKNDENTSFFSDADLLIMDAQYTLGEAIEKYNWGHNAFSLAVDFVANWNIKHMVLFHHDPASDDHKLYNILQSASLYTEKMNNKGIKISLATEGMEINL
jgi:phosphoribosyl 1,2-cyclic phosphodiesterase